MKRTRGDRGAEAVLCVCLSVCPRNVAGLLTFDALNRSRKSWVHSKACLNTPRSFFVEHRRPSGVRKKRGTKTFENFFSRISDRVWVQWIAHGASYSESKKF